MKIKHILLVLVSFTVISCAEGNVLEWATDKNTTEARKDKLDFAFIQGNCQYVINMLAPYDGMLSGTELYQYSNAILACSGFDVLESLNIILDEYSVASGPFNLIQSLMGTSVLTAENIKNLKDQYSKVINNCSTSYGTMTSEMDMICGLAAAADTVATISEIALALSGGESITATEEGIKQIVTGKTKEEITQAVDNAVATGSANLGNLSKNLDIITTSSESITAIAGGNIQLSLELDKFTKDVSDTSGEVTNASLSSYINDKFRNNIGGTNGTQTP